MKFNPKDYDVIDDSMIMTDQGEKEIKTLRKKGETLEELPAGMEDRRDKITELIVKTSLEVEPIMHELVKGICTTPEKDAVKFKLLQKYLQATIDTKVEMCTGETKEQLLNFLEMLETGFHIGAKEE